MRVVIFSGFYLPHIGGAIYDTHALARGLMRKGHDVTVATCNTGHYPKDEIIDGVRIIRLSSWKLLNGQYPVPKLSGTLYRLLFRDADVVSTQTRFFVTSFIGMVTARLQGAPLVHTERGAMHSVVQNKLVDRVSRAYDHIIGASISRDSDACVGVSEETCGFLRHLGGVIPVRIPLGVHEMFFDYVRKPGHSKRIVYVGRLIHAKGVQDLLTAFKQVKSRMPDASLVIIGDGDYRSVLEKIAGQDVRFTGSLSQDSVAAELASADVFVHPSYSEGMPSAVAEASAVGLPVIASDVGGTRELVEDGITGYLVKHGNTQAIADRILELFSDSAKTDRMGQAGRDKMLREYRWESVVSSYDRLLRGVVDRWTKN